MNKQIKRLLIAELSSKRTLAKSHNWDLPVTVGRWGSDTFYMLDFDEYNIFHFDTCVELDDCTFHCKETEKYSIDDLKQELKLSESWFEPFVNDGII